MNTIEVISIFICGFAFGLILFILLEKIFIPDVDCEIEDFYTVDETKLNDAKKSESRLSPKQRFLGDNIGLSHSSSSQKESSLSNMKSKVYELKSRNKVAL